MRTCSVLLAESNQLLREKIAGMLGRLEAVWCVGQVCGPVDLVRAAENLQPDLILADLGMLKEPGLVATLRRITPRAQVIGLADSVSRPYRQAAQRLSLDGLFARSRLMEGVAGRIGDMAGEVENAVSGKL